MAGYTLIAAGIKAQNSGNARIPQSAPSNGLPRTPPIAAPHSVDAAITAPITTNPVNMVGVEFT
jgi:hypothetical protein